MRRKSKVGSYGMAGTGGANFEKIELLANGHNAEQRGRDSGALFSPSCLLAAAAGDVICLSNFVSEVRFLQLGAVNESSW